MRELARALAVSLLTVAGGGAAYGGDLKAELLGNLKEFSPMAVEQEAGRVRVAFPVDQVSEGMYSALAMLVCDVQWSKKGSFEGMDEVILLNRHAWQGWVLERPAESCVKLGKAKSDEYSWALLSVSHMASQGN